MTSEATTILVPPLSVSCSAWTICAARAKANASSAGFSRSSVRGPEPQVWVTPTRRVDGYFRALKLAFEYQGSVDHGTRRSRRADAGRARELARAGIRVESLSAADLVDEDALTARVAALLTLRAKELGLPAPVFVG